MWSWIITYYKDSKLSTWLEEIYYIEESKKEIELISDLAVCLNIKNEEIFDIESVVKYVTEGEKFEFKSDICEETFGRIVEE